LADGRFGKDVCFQSAAEQKVGLIYFSCGYNAANGQGVWEIIYSAFVLFESCSHRPCSYLFH